MSLMASVEQSRSRLHSANELLLGASGVAKGITVGVAVANRQLLQAAADIADKVRSAQNALRNLPPAPKRKRKTYASVEGGKPILSGESRPELLRASEARAARVGTGFRRSGYKDNGAPGQYFHTHAERLVHEAHPGQPIGVSRPMCNKGGLDYADCVNHFQNLAEDEKRVLVVADPDKTRVFHPDSQIDELPNDIGDEELSKYTREAVTRPMREQGGLSKALVEGLENAHIQRASKALGPLGFALDAYSLKEAWDADGGKVGENVTSTAGGVAGGWAGAAAGAAIGSAAGPVGTVVGGVIGGVVGSGVGSKVAEGIGNLFD